MRLYRALLHLYPAGFRTEYAADMVDIFEARRQRTRGIAVIGLWLGTIVDTIFNAARVHVDVLRQDLRYTVRGLRRTPGFAFAAVLMTGLGIGATTAAFSITDLRSIPVSARAKSCGADAVALAKVRGYREARRLL